MKNTANDFILPENGDLELFDKTNLEKLIKKIS